MVDMIWNSSCGKIELEFKDAEQVFTMYHNGDCEETVKAEIPYFLSQLQKYNKETIVSVLNETLDHESFNEITPGAKNLDSVECNDLYLYLLWIAAWDKHDQINMEELCDWQNQYLSDREHEKSGE